jgi:hypothetical protein
VASGVAAVNSPLSQGRTDPTPSLRAQLSPIQGLAPKVSLSRDFSAGDPRTALDGVSTSYFPRKNS